MIETVLLSLALTLTLMKPLTCSCKSILSTDTKGCYIKIGYNLLSLHQPASTSLVSHIILNNLYTVYTPLHKTFGFQSFEYQMHGSCTF